MTRGIHLKQLKSADLDAIGVPNDGLRGLAEADSARSPGLLEEADPVLSQALADVRHGLEATLSLLEEALAATSPIKAENLVKDE